MNPQDAQKEATKTDKGASADNTASPSSALNEYMSSGINSSVIVLSRIIDREIH